MQFGYAFAFSLRAELRVRLSSRRSAAIRRLACRAALTSPIRHWRPPCWSAASFTFSPNWPYHLEFRALQMHCESCTRRLSTIIGGRARQRYAKFLSTKANAQNARIFFTENCPKCSADGVLFVEIAAFGVSWHADRMAAMWLERVRLRRHDSRVAPTRYGGALGRVERSLSLPLGLPEIHRERQPRLDPRSCQSVLREADILYS